MKIEIKRIFGTDSFRVYENGEVTSYYVRKEVYNSSVAYLFCEGNRVKARFNDRQSCLEFIRIFYLDKKGLELLGNK